MGWSTPTELDFSQLTYTELKHRLDEDVAPPVAFYDQDRDDRTFEHSPGPSGHIALRRTRGLSSSTRGGERSERRARHIACPWAGSLIPPGGLNFF